MMKRLQQSAHHLSKKLPPVNTPLRIAVTSFILSELITAAILWLVYQSLSLPAFIIAGVCSILAPFLISSHILQQQQTIREKNRELAKLAEQFRLANVRLSERNAQLNAFSHTVAHDLQSPLSAITGLSRLLEENYLRSSHDTVREHLRMIGQTTQKLSRIVEEILLLSQIREDQSLPLKPLEMSSIVREAADHLAYAVEQHDARLITPEHWPKAVGYGPWVEQVWINYLSNALKYGGRPPVITLGADVNKRSVRFWVKDNGPGLTKDKQELLFVPFKRLDEARVQGHGLGLSIVRNIVERLGGEVGVESNAVPGEGCCFYFTLPRAASMSKTSRHSTLAARQPTFEQSTSVNQPDPVKDLVAP